MKINMLVGALLLFAITLVTGYEYYRIKNLIEVHLPVFLKNETNAIAIQLDDALNQIGTIDSKDILLNVSPVVSVRIEIKQTKEVRTMDAKNAHSAPPQWFVNLLMKTPVQYQMALYSDSEKRVSIHTALIPNRLLMQAWLFFIASLVFFVVLYFSLTRLVAIKEKLLEQLTLKLFNAFSSVRNSTYERHLESDDNPLIGKVMSEFDSVVLHHEQQYKVLQKEKRKFESLTQYDELTGLANKQCFHKMMKEKLREKEGLGGHVLLLKLSSLDQINIQLGRQEGDIYISRMANVLNKLCNAKNIKGHVFRNLGSEMLVVILNADNTTIDFLAEELKGYLQRLDNENYKNGCGYFSVVQFKPGQKLSELMILLDYNLSQAMTNYHNSYAIAQADNVAVGGLNHWFKKIDEIIKNKKIILHRYTVEQAPQGTDSYRYEIRASFDIKGETFNAKDVFSAAKRFDLSYKIDQLIITRLIEYMKLEDDEGGYAVKISESSVINERFRNWLSHLLSHHRGLAKRLVFQLPEVVISEHFNESQLFINVMHNAKSKVALACDTQNKVNDLIEAVRLLSIDVVKINSHEGPSLEQFNQDVSFIKQLVTSAHEINVAVVVDHVENKKSWAELNKLGIDGGQGDLFGEAIVIAS